MSRRWHSTLPWLLVLAASPSGAGPLGLFLNEDDSHFYGSRTAGDMTLDGLHAFVDQYAGTKVTRLFLCPNAMRTSYDSAVWDAIWETGSQKVPEDEPFAQRWVENARLLAERGLDPYAVWSARCREKGISPWLSMRMNDVHNADDPQNYLHSTFWLAHPEFRRVPDSPRSWQDRAFDYAHPEVREHSMRLIRELLERYDADGLELDWMRFGYHIKPGQEKEGAAILTQFMRDVRGLTKEWAAKRGHPVRLGARVPAHPDAAVGLGMDGIAWVREGLVDVLVPTPFWATSDFDIPMELWRERIGAAAKDAVLAAGIEVLIRAYPGGAAVLNDIESVRGFAVSARHRGADTVYLFNYMDPAPMDGGAEAYRALLEQGLEPEALTGLPRRHVMTYRDTVLAGVSAGVALPAAGRAGATFRIHIGPRPAHGATLVVGLSARDGLDGAAFDAEANGAPCAPADDAEAPDRYPGVKRALRFDCPLNALKEGYNDFRVTQRAEGAEQEIIWVEVRIDQGK